MRYEKYDRDTKNALELDLFILHCKSLHFLKERKKPLMADRCLTGLGNNLLLLFMAIVSLTQTKSSLGEEAYQLGNTSSRTITVVNKL